MIGPETAAFLRTGCALIVGTVAPDGAPHAGRGWGLDILDDGAGEAGTTGEDGARIRLLLDTDDHVTLAHVEAGGAIAVTGTSVRTLHSIQLKGRALGLEPPCDSDQRRAEQFLDAFFADIMETDGTPLERMQRAIPSGYRACTIAVDEIFDQTPGPEAGAAIVAG